MFFSWLDKLARGIVQGHWRQGAHKFKPRRRTLSRQGWAAAAYSRPRSKKAELTANGIELLETRNLLSTVGIASLYGTGVQTESATGTNAPTALLTPGQIDPHYRIISTPTNGYLAPYITLQNGWPNSGSNVPWAPNDSYSRWISPQANENSLNGGAPNDPAGNYIYETHFNLAGLDPATVVLRGTIYSDDELTDVTLNGASTGMRGGGFTGSAFNITGGFLPGFNTLDFYVTNDSGPLIHSNPSGMRLSLTQESASTLPTVFVLTKSTIVENSPIGNTVGQFIDVTTDVGGAKFALVSGTGSTDNSCFTMDSSGNLYTAVPLNYAAKNSYSIRVQETNYWGQTFQQAFTINVTRAYTAPVIPYQSFSITDTSTNGAYVGSVVATVAPGDTESFAIIGGNNSGAFSISSGGVITVADSTKLNYLNNSAFNLTVSATESHNLTASNTVTINLIHVKAPSNIVLSNSSITEGLAAGTSAGQFTNPDLSGVAVQYSLVAGSGGDDNSSFTIDSSGVLRSTASFDYDLKNSYSIRVRATDQWGLTYDKIFTISVVDVFEAPVMTAQSFSIPDNLPNGSVVGTISASVDAGDTVAFSIAGGNTLGAFAVTSTGVITVADSTKLSFLLNPVVKLTVSATDSLNLASTSTVTINLTEAKPPALAGIEGTTLIYTGATPVVVSTSIATNAPDSLTLNSAVIQIANGYQNGTDSLKFTNTSTISGTWNSSTGTLILSGSDTVANYQAALRSISFQNTGTNTTARTISFQVSDGFLSSNSISRVVDAPPNVLSLVTAGSNPTSGPAIQFTVTFSEAVTGVSSANFSLVETGWVSATGMQVAAVSPAVYTITVNGVTGTGTLGVNLSNPGNIIDAGNNLLTGKYSGQVVTVDTKPAVTLQPTNFSVAAGGAASFTAAASGFPAPGTQWQVSRDNGSTWENISGATSATYSFVTSTTDNGSVYRAVFTNAVGVATSSVATLSVSQAPVVTVYWTGLGDGHSWSNAANWSTKSIPGANDNVLINAASGTVIHGPTATTTVRNLTITSANFYVDGAFLTVTNGVIVGNGQSLTVGNYSSLIPGSISLNGASLTLTLNGTIKGGTVTETGAANIAVVGSAVLDGTTVNGNVSVTHANNDSLFLRNTVTLNGTLLIGATDGSTWATIFFNDAAAGAVTLTGNASVIFGGNTTNGINFYDNGGAITLGSNVILHGNNGRVVNTFYTGTVLFQGTVAADVAGGTISFASSTVVDQNTGTLTASNGGTLALSNTWTNTCTVTSTGSGNVVLAGIVNNSAGTINLDGSLTLQQNGTVKGGTINETANGNLAVFAGVLDGTTVNGNISLTHAINDYLILRGVVTLNGTMLIGATDGSTSATLYFRDDAGNAIKLAGNASVVFGGNTTNGINFYDNGGAITLGSNVTLHGKNGRIGNTYYAGTVLFQGTVAADVAGGTITFASSTVTDQNSGTLTASNGGTLALNNNWTNTGTVTSRGSGNVVLAGIVDNNSGVFNLDGSLTLQQNGTVKGGTINETANGNLAVFAGVLDGTTVNGNISLTHAINDYLILRGVVTLNGTMLIGATDGSTSATLYFRDDAGNAITLAGNASVVFGGNTTNGINFYDNGGTITFGSNVTLHGKNGRIGNTYYAGTVLFQGTVAADVAGGTITFASSTVTDQNSGTLTASNGGTLALYNNWKNTGKVTVTAGGNLLLLGAVDNSQGTFALDGLLTMQGGQGSAITGGTVTETANGNISVVTAAILDNVTINGNISLTHGAGEYLILRDTVTLNGTLNIGAADGSSSEVVYLGYGSSNAVTLAGNATLLFGSGTNNTIDNFVATGTTTLASTVTIRGKTGSLINNSATGTILNQGTISADVSGGTITAGNYAGFYQNTGTFKASNGGVLVVSGAGITNSLAGLIESPTGTIQFGSNLLTTATNTTIFDPEGNVTFNLNANAASAKLLEAASQDLGNVAAGFVNNSAFGSLNLTNGTYVKLVNQTHNTGSSIPEAVYVNSLNVAANTTLDLNGLHLYALNASIKGTILNGTINAIGVAPAVTTQPSSTNVLPGTTASFTATASGTLTPTVQWQVTSNGGTTWTNIVGATSTTYSFTTALGNNGNQYRAVFTNPSGTATTNSVTLTVASANVTSTIISWGTSGSATLMDASGGRMLPTGRTNDIDWLNISSGTVTLDRSIPSLSSADISVIGSVGGNYGPVTVSGSGTTWIITLAKPIANADKVIVTIGNGQMTSYQRELDILPGDFNDDGVVDSSDVTLLNNATVAPYNVFADLNGDGVIDTNDGILARTKIGTKRIL